MMLMASLVTVWCWSTSSTKRRVEKGRGVVRWLTETGATLEVIVKVGRQRGRQEIFGIELEKAIHIHRW